MSNSDQPSKRRKTVKSCLNCRSKKLRCDKDKPICSSCKAREAECLYQNEEGIYEPIPRIGSNGDSRFDITKENSISSFMEKLDMMQAKLNDIDAKITNNKLSVQSSLTHDANDGNINLRKFYDNEVEVINPLSEFYFTRREKSGKNLVYGPTSIRTYLEKDKWGFGQKIYELSSKLEEERSNWKVDNPTWIKATELQIFEKNLNEQFSSENVCSTLPNNVEVLQSIDMFFNPEFDELFQIHFILDKHKVIKDFNDCFKIRKGKIVSLNLAGGRNFYKIGVILMILCFTYYVTNIPKSIHQFVIQLIALYNPKNSLIEKLQFLTLNCEFARYSSPDSNNSSIISILGSITSCALAAGLDKDISFLYKDKEYIVGSIQTIENLWLMVLYYDVETSYRLGASLRITNAIIVINDSSNVGLTSMERFQLQLKKFLKITRHMMQGIMNPYKLPKLKDYCNILNEFICKELRPISEYTDKEKFQDIPLREIRLVILLLDMMLTFISLRFAVLKESRGLKLPTIQITLIWLKMNELLMQRFYNLDKVEFIEKFDDGYTGLPPWLMLYTMYIDSMMIKVCGVFSAFIYHMLVRFKKMLNLNLLDSSIPISWDYSYIFSDNDSEFNIVDAVNLFFRFTRSWISPDTIELAKMFQKSLSLVVVKTMVKILLTIIDTTLEYRSSIENSWNPPAAITEAGDKSPTRIPYEKAVDNIASTNTLANDVDRQSLELDDKTLKSLSDEFWNSYNAGWEQLLNNPIPDSFYDAILNDLS